MHDVVSIDVSKLAHCHGDRIERFVSNYFVIGDDACAHSMARKFGLGLHISEGMNQSCEIQNHSEPKTGSVFAYVMFNPKS